MLLQEHENALLNKTLNAVAETSATVRENPFRTTSRAATEEGEDGEDVGESAETADRSRGPLCK